MRERDLQFDCMLPEVISILYSLRLNNNEVFCLFFDFFVYFLLSYSLLLFDKSAGHGISQNRITSLDLS